jgi:hypothetical protein
MTSLVWSPLVVTFKDFTSGVRPDEGKPATYDLDPIHQRNVVHTDEWQADIIDSGLRFGMIPTVYFHTRVTPEGRKIKESLDGKQRCSAVVRFLSNEFRIKLPEHNITIPTYFKDLPEQLRYQIEDCNLDLKICSTTLAKQQIEDFFNRAQKTKKTTPGEFLNSCTSSYRRRVLDANSERVTALCELLSPGTRHDHVAMFGRLWFAFKSSRPGPSGPSYRPFYAKDTPTLKAFWMEEDAQDHADEASFLSSLDLLKHISAMGCPRPKGSIPQGTYIPLYKFLLEHYFQKDNEVAQQTLEDLRALFKAEPNVFGTHTAGSGVAEANERFERLKFRLGKK